MRSTLREKTFSGRVDAGATVRILDLDCRETVSGVRLWVQTQGAATIRVYSAPSAAGSLRVELDNFATVANTPQTRTFTAPAGWLTVEYTGGVGPVDVVDAHLLAV